MNAGSKSAFKLVRDLLVRGALFIIPVWLTLFVVGVLYALTDAWLGGLTAQIVRWIVPAELLATLNVPNGHIPGLSLITGLVFLAVLGAIGSWHIGRRGLRLIDHVFLAIPGISTIYSSARKIIDALGEPGGKSRFQKVVYVPWGVGTKTLGFVTNEVTEPVTNRKQYLVFVPTVPNPTAGFVINVYVEDAIVTDYTPEEGLKLAMSLGVIAPEK